jgi:predicted enzyme related to lactoylglutathione lyase
VQASAEFYRDAFCWDLSEPSGPLRRREWLVDDRPIAGLLPRPAAMPAEVPVYWDTYLGTADPDAAIRLAATLGATVLMGPADVEIGRIGVFADPTGAVFSVLAPATTTTGE